MRVRVRFRLPSGELQTVGHGAIIGRLHASAICLADPRISEAHALVSLRGRDVRLLALRGRFSVDGKTSADVVLRSGLTVLFAPGLSLTVVGVDLPDEVMALEGPFGRQVLLGPTSVLSGPPRLRSGWRPDAVDVVWPDDDRWVRRDGTELAPGDVIVLPEGPVTAVSEPLGVQQATLRSADFSVPVRLIARFDSVHLLREGERTVVLTGIIARIITELVQTQSPVAWHVLAEQIWGDVPRDILRRRWDMQQVRLRAKLREYGLRGDLLRADGGGLIELVLGAEDEAIDES
ncbi:MAG: hypothetical protein ACJATT_004222 [Myxococcota bacterium]|jgi:hypothetical protein